MGALHKGHLALVAKAKATGLPVVVSVYVNPRQFAPEEDFASYPRSLAADARLLKGQGVLFVPDTIYQKNFSPVYKVAEGLAKPLCGGVRPTHFQGVADAVERLFHLIKPKVAVFGEKDYQQVLVIKQMVAALKLKTEIATVATVRCQNGLAVSSRNQYLTARQRQTAPKLHRVMRIIAQSPDLWEHRSAYLKWGVDTLTKRGFKMDYLELRHPQTLKPALRPPARLFAAGTLGTARLIDNCAV